MVSCNMRIFIYVLCLSLSFSCMNNKLLYRYADGSANQYHISPTSLAYIPVKPEQSSSGHYSGGEPKTVNITSEQFTSLQNLFEKAIRNQEIQIKDRIKTSGQITVEVRSEQKHYIIQPKSAELMEIEALLKQTLEQ